MNKIKEIVKQVLKWIGLHFIPILQFIAIAGILVINFITSTKDRSDSEKLIIGVLIFICFDIFIFSLGYLENIKTKVANILTIISNQKQTIGYSNRFPREVREKIENAKHKIFISGTAMSFLHSNLNTYIDLINNNVKIIFAYSAVEGHGSKDIDKYLREFFNKSYQERKISKDTLKTGLNNMKSRISEDKKKNLQIISMNLFVPIGFTAVDYEKEQKSDYSVICAKHYLLDKEGKETNRFWITVEPDSQLYDKYLEQIHIIEEHPKGNLAASTRFNKGPIHAVNTERKNKK